MGASTISALSSSVYAGDSIVLRITADSSQYRHELSFCLGTAYSNIEISSNVAAGDYTWLVPSYLEVESASGDTCQVMCVTYNGSTQIGATLCTFTVLPYVAPYSITPLSSSVYIGDSLYLQLTSSDSRYKFNLYYVFGTTTNESIENNVGSGRYVWNVPSSLNSRMGSATSGRCLIGAVVYSGSTIIGRVTCTVTLRASGSAPNLALNSVTEATDGIASKFGGFVQGKSTLRMVISASGQQGATVQRVDVTVGEDSYTYADNGLHTLVTRALSSSGAVPISITATDSRGVTRSIQSTVSVLPYATPVISALRAYRVDPTGTETEIGTRLGLDLSYAISPAGNLNDHTYAIKCKLQSDPGYTTLASGSADWTHTAPIAFLDGPDIDYDNVYSVRVELTDFFGTITAETILPSGFSLVDYYRTGHGIAFGKSAERDGFDVSMPSWFRGDMQIDGDLTVTGSFPVPSPTPAAKIDLTLAAGWSSVSGYADPYVWIDYSGVAHLYGVIQKASQASIGSEIINLPDGCHPAHARIHLAAYCGSSSYGSASVYRLSVGTDGSVTASQIISSSTPISLCDITFPTAAAVGS